VLSMYIVRREYLHVRELKKKSKRYD